MSELNFEFDSCQYCVYRGDINECLAAKCSQHESWFAEKQSKRIDNLQQSAEECLAIIVEHFDQKHPERDKLVELLTKHM